jgi:hypothetical protein
LSETVSFENIGTLEIEDQINLSGNFGSETYEREESAEDWGGELTALVTANAGVIVRCPWLGGSEVTLSEAMNTYSFPANLTEEDEPFLISVVCQLLANRVIEAEELKEEDEPEKEEKKLRGEDSVKTEENTSREEKIVKTERTGQKANTKTESQKTSKSPDAVTKPNIEIDESKKQEQSTMRHDKRTMRGEAKVIANHDESKQPRIHAAKNEANARSSNGYADTKHTNSHSEPQVGVAENLISVGSVEPIVERQQILPEEMFRTGIQASPVVDSELIPDSHMRDQDTESLTLPIDMEETAGLESTEPLFLDLKNEAIYGEAAELTDEEFEISEDALLQATLEYESGVNSLIDFDEQDEFIVDHFEESDIETDEDYSISNAETIDETIEAEEVASSSQPSYEKVLSEQTDTSGAKQTPQAITITGIDAPFVELAETLKTSEPEITKMVSEITDKIIEVSTKVATENKVGISEAGSQEQEELEELFTELFANLGIDFSPDLIKSLAYLTIKPHLVNGAIELKIKEKVEESTQDEGTHEIINNLLLGLGIIKKPNSQVYDIGKSALALYSLNLAI